ncbi:MAG: flavin reductase [Bacteroidaceae bacterium]|nr:flavin reductase [Bacteroidaceae bacterium]
MKEVNYKDLRFNPFTLFGNEWMLLSAGNGQTGCNTMTISWGHLGCLWGNNDPTAVVYIRQSRYTKKFVDEEERFSLCVMDKSFKKEMLYLGTVSGRDEDKIAKTGLTPVYADGTVYFAEAKLVLVCKKLYAVDMKKEDFISQEPIVQCYPEGDYHTLYVGKIEKILARDDEYLRPGTCPAE